MSHHASAYLVFGVAFEERSPAPWGNKGFAGWVMSKMSEEGIEELEVEHLSVGYDYEMSCLVVSGSEIKAYCGYAKPLDLKKLLEKEPEYRAKFNDFCEKMGYQPDEEPSWFLAPLYG